VRYVRHVSRARHLAHEYWFELLIVFLAIAGMLELVAGRDLPGAPATRLWIAIPTIAILVLLLLARRRFPFGAPAAYWLLAAAISFGDGVLLAFVGSLSIVGLASAFLLGNLRNPCKAGAGLIIVVIGILVVVYNIPGETASDLAFITLRFVVAWVAGYALRERAEQVEAAEERATHAELRARIAVAEERGRIARELHDIVAHAVSVMVLQAGVVRRRLSAPSEDRDLLNGVELAGKNALAEMRRLLAAMRREGEEADLVPQPGLDGLDSLLDEVSRAGLPVELHVDGKPFPLPRGIDLSAYRIVQEGLTNALKHAHASDADVTVRYRPDELEIEVRDNGQGSPTSDGLGHGLIGVRERVTIYGGKMTAGTAVDGGFVLNTRLPLAQDDR
jgi:signal transduction histidine kinase